MKNNDDFLTRQGDIYTLVDANGYLVREDIKGERKRYLLQGEGGEGGGAVNSVNGQTGDVVIEIPTVPSKLVNSVNGKTGEVVIDIPTIPSKLVNSVNGKTGEVVIDIPTKTSDLTNNSDFTTKGYVDGKFGDIETILDAINGEVI